MLLRPKRHQNNVHPVLLRTTKYYSSTTKYYKVLLQYYSSTTKYKVLLQYYSVLQRTTPVLLRTTKHYSDLWNDVRTIFQQQASKTSISCEASATFEATSFQNEHFVRGFLQISHFQLENRWFHASFSYKAIFTELKKYVFCEASATFQNAHQMLRLPRYLQGCHVCASLPLRFIEKALSSHHKVLRLPRHRKRPHHKVLRLPRKNDALALTRFPRIAPVTQKAKTTSYFVTWDRQNEHFVRDFLHFSHFEGKDCVALRMYRPMERN